MRTLQKSDAVTGIGSATHVIRKISPYTAHSVNIGKDEQLAPEFLRISPNNKIPAIVDKENDIALMESGAILLYLANKTGKLLVSNEEDHWRTIEWLMWQMGGVGPIFGQVHHFSKFNSGVSEYAEERYVNEAKRLYKVLNERLEGRSYLVDDYSIADIATWPWVSRYEWQMINLNDYLNVKRWYIEIAQRPAVQRGYDVPSHVNKIPIPD